MKPSKEWHNRWMEDWTGAAEAEKEREQTENEQSDQNEPIRIVDLEGWPFET